MCSRFNLTLFLLLSLSLLCFYFSINFHTKQVRLVKKKKQRRDNDSNKKRVKLNLEHIDQILISVRCRDNNKHIVLEALRRCKYKFPGRQKIASSPKWGFTKVNREDYAELRANNKIIPDGTDLKYINERGPLSKYFYLQNKYA
eukprot:Lithocolla_globosa_v1_NODE_10864_length_558_cov_4302.532803.p1 type:complete len:144 gc:universal NODE_10864_length_558_cov_4302.532803:79-510(+)